MIDAHMVCYLDYNATTVMPPEVVDTLTTWATRGNPSSTYPSAKEGKKLMNCFREEIARHCGFSLDDYAIIFTSGGSESNSMVISSTIRAFKKAVSNDRPHIITSNVEHDSIRLLLGDFEEEGVDVTYVPVHTYGPRIGSIDIDALVSVIRPNTCLITVMAANNETGVINDIKTIGKIAKQKSIPFHSDAVQLFQKLPFRPLELNVTAFSVSFHKLFGPTGCGLAVIKKDFLEGYNLRAMIGGSQNDHMRGGTECIHNIAAARSAFHINFTDRMTKNAMIRSLKQYMKELLGKYIVCMYLDEYRHDSNYINSIGTCIVWLCHRESMVQDGTLFLAVHKHKICNVDIRNELTDDGIYISIGSACKTTDKKASHVLDGIDLPKKLRPGVFRISIGDYSSKTDIDMFVRRFLMAIGR